MRRRKIAIILAVLIILSACGSDEKNDNEGGKEESYDDLANCENYRCAACGEFCREWFDDFPADIAEELGMNDDNCFTACGFFCSQFDVVKEDGYSKEEDAWRMTGALVCVCRGDSNLDECL
jgi:hypothetical protein